jgi:autotransporter-associated beta strand protein
MKVGIALTLAVSLLFSWLSGSRAADFYIRGEKDFVLTEGSGFSYVLDIDNPSGCADPLIAWTLSLIIQPVSAPEHQSLEFQHVTPPEEMENYLLEGRSSGFDPPFSGPSGMIEMIGDYDSELSGVEVSVTGKSLLEVQFASAGVEGRFSINANPGLDWSYWSYFNPVSEELETKAFANIPFDAPSVVPIGSIVVQPVANTRWTGIIDNDWEKAGNWTDGVPESEDVIQFDTPNASPQTVFRDVVDPIILTGIAFTNSTGEHILGGSALQLAGCAPAVACASSSNQSINNSIILADDTVFFISGSGSLTLGGTVSGNSMLIKSGSGTLVLTGSGTYGGETLIEKGILALDTPQGQIEKSAITNDATFQILSGDHSVGTIAGTGTTEVLSGSLVASSITQNTLSIGASRAMTIAPAADRALKFDPRPIPEPATLGLLTMVLVSLAAGNYVSRIWK